MKQTLYALLLAGLSLNAQHAATPQALPRTISKGFPIMDIYGVAPRSFSGGGVGLGGFSSPFTAPAFLGSGELRIGGDFYFSGIDRRVFRDVPLLEPQTGKAKVKLHESLFGLNLAARLSAPWEYKVTPYADGFAGLRVITTGITITPNDYQPGYESSSSDNLDAAFAFQYGVAAGVLISLNPNLKLNAAVHLSRSEWPGMLKDIRSASVAETGVMMSVKQLPRDMMMFKLGLTFRIDPDECTKEHRCSCCGQRISSEGSGRSWGGGYSRPAAPNRVGTGVRVTK